MLQQALRRLEVIAIPRHGVQVERTVAEALIAHFAPGASLLEEDEPVGREGSLVVSVAGDAAAAGRRPDGSDFRLTRPAGESSPRPMPGGFMQAMASSTTSGHSGRWKIFRRP